MQIGPRLQEQVRVYRRCQNAVRTKLYPSIYPSPVPLFTETFTIFFYICCRRKSMMTQRAIPTMVTDSRNKWQELLFEKYILKKPPHTRGPICLSLLLVASANVMVFKSFGCGLQDACANPYVSIVSCSDVGAGRWNHIVGWGTQTSALLCEVSDAEDPLKAVLFYDEEVWTPAGRWILRVFFCREFG